MVWSRLKKTRKLSIFLLIVILLAIGMIVSVFIGYRQVSNAPELLLTSIKEGANLSLGKIRQTATRDGKKEWSLEADSANYMEAENKVDLKNLSVIYFLEDNREVYLEADQGILQTDTNDIEFSGNVVIRNEDVSDEDRTSELRTRPAYHYLRPTDPDFGARCRTHGGVR